MRSLLAAAAVVLGLVIAGCSNQGPVEISTPTLTPRQAPTVALAATTQATPILNSTPTNAPDAALTPSPTTRRASSARTTPVPLPTRDDGLPIPAGARETRNVPDIVRTFLQTQLKGQHRIGEPAGYLVSQPPSEAMQQYQAQLQGAGWEAVPLSGNLPDNVQVIVAQKDVRAIIVFTTETNGDTLVYVVTTQK